jgi:hypothetical protein
MIATTLVQFRGVSDCAEPAADFRGTFERRSPDDRRTLEALTAWAEQLCNEGVAELTFGESGAVYVNLNSALCSVPSISLSTSSRQLPRQVLLVAQK